MDGVHGRVEHAVEAFVGRPERAYRLHRTHQRNGADELEADLATGHKVDAQETETRVADFDGAENRHRKLKVAQGMVVCRVLAVAD